MVIIVAVVTKYNNYDQVLVNKQLTGKQDQEQELVQERQQEEQEQDP
jgi:hypothetical protein